MELNQIYRPPNRRRPLDLRSLSNLQLPPGIMEDLIRTGCQLIIQINHDGSLNLSLVDNLTSAIVTKPLKPVMKNRPAIHVNFSQRDEEKRRQLFAKPRLCDYLGNEKERLVEIAKSGDLRDKYRMRTLIDSTDDQIAKYFGCNLYSLKWDKRPRIKSFDEHCDLYHLLPHKIAHLINLVSYGSSLIMHRRSQRLASMPIAKMSRMERLFYFCPYPKDGYYPISFEPEKEEQLIQFVLNEPEGANCFLNAQQKKIFSEYLQKVKLGIQPNFKKFPQTVENLDLRDAERYRSRKYQDPSSLNYSREVPFPGIRMQKQFLRELWSETLSMPINHLQNIFSNSVYIQPRRSPGSEGFLTREGRLAVKTNLRNMYRYQLYVKHQLQRDTSNPYWEYELQETKNILIVNLLVWKTNSIEPFRPQSLDHN